MRRTTPVLVGAAVLATLLAGISRLLTDPSLGRPVFAGIDRP